MPRDGSGIFTAPFPNVVTETTIESPVHNGTVSDFVTDANAARPIIAGGTGATSAAAARTNLHAEVSGQTVTNYDTQVWENGSFLSIAGATAAPASDRHYTGSCVILTGDNNFITLKAIDANTGENWHRQKIGGTWGAWVRETSVTLISDGEGIAAATGDMWYGVRGTAPSSAFVVNSESDLSGTNLLMVHHSGDAQFTNILTVGSGGATGGLYFGNTATKTLTYDGTNFAFNGASLHVTGGGLTVSSGLIVSSGGLNVSGGGLAVTGNAGVTGNVTVSGNASAGGDVNGSDFHAVRASAPTQGYVFFGNTLAAYQYWNGSVYSLIGGGLSVAGAVTSDVGYHCRSGISGSFQNNYFNFFWSGGGNVQLWLDTTNLGVVTTTSDYRIKKDVLDLPGMWDTVKALRPIKYTQAQFTPPSDAQHKLDQALADRRAGLDTPAAKPGSELVPMYAADDIERWGFIAHELQATLLPTAANGVKDAPDEIQSLNLAPLVAALTKALQEAMTRIEALEAGP